MDCGDTNDVINTLGCGTGLDYDKLIQDFVALHAGRARQRTDAWLAKKSVSIGGSEVAALMGWNPYSSFDQVVALKAGIQTWDGGSVACWWGSMFESVIERFVEIDCKTQLAGTDISVPAPTTSELRGFHANSPDGYGVITLFLNVDDEWQILGTSAENQAAAEGRPRKQIIALFEFKCPFRRHPKGEIPKHYRPQIWSGLALSPIAHTGVFVDAVFRKCMLWNLGPETGYDYTYHYERKNPSWTYPIAWGLTGIYAPRLDANRGKPNTSINNTSAIIKTCMSGVSVDAAYEAWRLHYTEFGISFESPEEADRAGRPFCPDPIDFGDCEKKTFETMMFHLDKGQFKAKHVGPCFPDGRGAPLLTPRAIGATIDSLATSPPPGYYLLGVIPWKIFEVDYVFQERQLGFLENVAPLIHECLEIAEQFRKTADPKKEYYSYLESKRQSQWRAMTQDEIAKNGAVSADDVQNLFDQLTDS